MSTVIDNRVLEMRFDNKQFEKNVSTTMSTLDKLKQKLNLKGAEKGLTDLGKAAKGVDFKGMSASVHQVGRGLVSLDKISTGVIAKFSVINNLTNQLMHTGKRMVNALTIDPVKTGFHEYETQINAIQTILSNTRQEGTNVEIVNRALDELNKYADKTIYNFTEMTRNIGTFTAAGVKLDTSVNAIKGIANLAAVSGSTSQQASSAMYQLSQALAAGKVSLMDWNSVVNAGMGGKVFQDALIRTSELLGTGAKAAIEAEGSFRDSLTKGQWLTTEVLTETLNQLSGAYTEADLISQGYTKAQAKEIMALAKDAEDAATKVKTFTQLWDVMKEAAQSGWAQTWRILVGDFEEAKALFTPLSDFATGIIGKFSDSRNALLTSSLTKNFTDFKMFDRVRDSVDKLLSPVQKVSQSIDKVKESFQDLSKVVDDVIGGKFGNGEDRFDALTKSGYNWMEVQNKVNKKLGNSYRYTKEQIEAQTGLVKVQEKSNAISEEAVKTSEKMTDTEKHRLQQMIRMSEKQMRLNGYTKEQIAAVRELKSVAKELGVPITELIANIDEINGRWLILNSFKNIGEGLLKVFGTVGQAWGDVFTPIQPEQIFNAVTAFSRFSSTMIMTDESANNLRSTFKGLFATFDLMTSLTGGGLKFGFKILSQILDAFDLNVLEVTGNVGEAIYAFDRWLFEGNALTKAMDGFTKKLPGYANKTKEWFNAFKEIPSVDKFLKSFERIQDAFLRFSRGKIDYTELAQSLGENLAKALMSLPEIMVQIGRDVIAGFQNGIEEGLSNSIIGRIISFALEFISAFAAALGCHSPSVKTHEIGVNTIQGFINGIQEMLAPVLDVIKYIGEQIVNAFKLALDYITDKNGNIQWDKIFGGALLISGLLMLKKFVDSVGAMADGFGHINNILENAAESLKSFSKVLNGYSWDLKAKAIQKLAISIGILVGAIFVLSKIDNPNRLWNAVGIVGALAGILVGLAVAMELMSKSSIRLQRGKIDIEGLKSSILQIGVTLGLLALVVKMIGNMNADEAKQGFTGLTGMAAGMIVFIAAIGKLVKTDALQNIDKVGKMMTKLSIAMILMVGVAKLAGKLSPEEMFKGVVFATAFGVFVRAITKVAKDSGEYTGKVGGMAVKLSIAMGLMVGVVKLVGKLSPEEMFKGVVFATAFGVFVKTLVKSISLGEEQKIAAIGRILLSLSISMGLMIGVMKLIGKLSPEEMFKGIAFVTAYTLFVKAVVKAVSIGNDRSIAKISGTILAMSVAIGLLAGVSFLLSKMSLGGLTKGITAVGLLGFIMSMMIKSLKGAQYVHKSIMMMTVAIGTMALAVVSLSMIDTGDLFAATAALSVLMTTFGIMSKSLKGIRRVPLKPIASIMGVVIALSGVIMALSKLKAGSALESVSSISILMLSLSSAMEIMDSVGHISRNSIKALTAISLIASGVGLAMTLLTKLNPGPTLEIAASLSLVLISLATTAKILSTISPIAATGMMGAAKFIGLVTVIGSILGVVGGLVGLIPGAENFLKNGVPILETIGSALGGLIGGFIGGIGIGVTNQLPHMSENITEFMKEIANASKAAADIDGDSFSGIRDLCDAMLNVSIGALIDKFVNAFGESSMEVFGRNIESFMESMQTVSTSLANTNIDTSSINKIAKSGQLLAELNNAIPPQNGFVQAWTGTKNLGDFGAAVETFSECILEINKATNVEGFTFNESAINAISKAGKGFSKLANSIPLKNGFVQDWAGSSELGLFGTAVETFSECILDINKATSIEGFTFNESAINAISKAGKGFSKLANLIPLKNGFVQDWVGSSELGSFGESVKEFATSMIDINAALGVDFSLNTEAISQMVSAGTALNGLQEVLPKTGGWWQDVAGTEDIGNFGDKVKSFGEAMSGFSTAIGPGVDETVVQSVTTVASAMTELMSLIAGDDWTDGMNKLGEFSSYIGLFGEAVHGFDKSVDKIDTDNISKAINSAGQIKELVNSLKDVSFDNIASFAGEGLADGSIVNIGQAIQSFGNSIRGINVDDVATAVNTANRIRVLIDLLKDFDSSGISNFKIVPLGEAIKGYSNAVIGIDIASIQNSISAAERIKTFISTLSDFESGNVGKFKTAVDNLGKVNMSAISKSFDGENSKMTSSGSNLISSFASGIKSKQSTVTSAASTIIHSMENVISGKKGKFNVLGVGLISAFVAGFKSKSNETSATVRLSLSSATSAASSYYYSFYSCGSYVAGGLAAGIRANIWSAAQAAAEMARAAANAAKANLKIASPSKVFRKIGEYVIQGFVVGISSMSGLVKSSIYNMTNKAVEGTNAAIGRMNDIFHGDMVSRPTIRPVMDLSDISYGVSTISEMFNNPQRFDVMADLRSIGAQMSNRNQNGTISDVVDSLNKLRRELENVGNTSYSINGITYDDGSNISEAVQSIIRAARMERRI